MRRLVLEVSGDALLRRLARSPGIRRIRTFEVLHILRYDQNEFAAICRITLRDVRGKVEDCFRGDPVRTELQVLEREPAGRDGQNPPSAVVLLKRQPRTRVLIGRDMTRAGAGYLLGPFGLREGKIRLTFLGNQSQVAEFLGKAKIRGLRYRVVSLTDVDFRGSLLDRLTRRQREVVRAAFELGYYDVPRTIHAEQLAGTMGLRAGTVVEHLRKAERRLLAGLYDQA